jgi:hypothetical protein
MKIELTGREIAIIGATLRRCIGWDDPRELERFAMAHPLDASRAWLLTHAWFALSTCVMYLTCL